MARIRSVHPGLFTDEAFVSCSAFARLLAIGIWTLSDDHGIFEWKPLSMKMKLMPADTVDIPALLDELVAADVITRFTQNARQFGAVRNFFRYQRPKKPKYIHVMPVEIGTYVGVGHQSTEQADGEAEEVPPQFPTDSPPDPQREEGGGRRDREKETTSPSLVHAPREGGEGEDSNRIFEKVLAVYPKSKVPISPLKIRALIAELPPQDRDRLMVGCAAYADGYRVSPTPNPTALEKFIRDRMFESYAVAQSKGVTAFVPIDTPEWLARVASGHKASLRTTETVDGRKVEGWRFPVASPPGHERSLGAA